MTADSGPRLACEVQEPRKTLHMHSLTAGPAGVTAAFLSMQACMNLKGRALCGASGDIVMASFCQGLQEHVSCANVQAGTQGLLGLFICSSMHRFTGAQHDSIAG